ncbi:retrovirus-related Pol polyprotein from transposon 297 [Trichonephila clavipes]|nr:retrovirus-related Pol polyprotein from transposon 297 [Trichonephila clavipes]
MTPEFLPYCHNLKIPPKKGFKAKCRCARISVSTSELSNRQRRSEIHGKDYSATVVTEIIWNEKGRSRERSHVAAWSPLIGRDVSDQVGVREKPPRVCQFGVHPLLFRGSFLLYSGADYLQKINLSDWSRVSGRISSHGVRTRHPFRWGKRRIHQIAFVVNNNREDVKTTVAILRDRLPPISSFNSTISIDNQDFPVKINVVPTHSINFDIIIGCNIIKQANLTITPDSVMFSKPQIQVSDASPQPFVFAITDDIPKFDIGPEIPKQTRNDVEPLLASYRPNKMKTTDIELSITVTDDKPIYHSPRRLPFTERDIEDKQIDEWTQNGVIEPCSSANASQILVVRKKDGSPRVYIDFRKLNRLLVKDHYPLPLIEDILDKLQDTRIFSTIDLRNGFFHVSVKKQSHPYTSFVTQNGQFQFLKMPFGLCTCPSTFQHFINTVFRNLVVQRIVLPYMDDIVILAKNEFEAIDRLKKVLKVSSDYGLKINFDKCQFLHRKIEFLGHIIENNKHFASLSKTKSVVHYPEPKTTKEVQRFLGLTGYFRKFIPAYYVIAKPLSDLLRKDTPFNFDEKQKASSD